jgi:DNA repair protein RadA/Sms
VPKAKANRVSYACTECGAATPRWVGRCPTCGAWNSLIEKNETRPAPDLGMVAATAVPITRLGAESAARRPTGVGELDRVLGGGLVAGSAVLLAGEPGIGKPTLLLQVLARLATSGKVLYVSAEESAEQVRLRAERLGALHDDLYLTPVTDVRAVHPLIADLDPDVLVVDSVQTVHDPELPGTAGSPTQVRETAAALVRQGKERGMAVLLVGQVTKDGLVAGPKTLEHLVDVVLNFEGDHHHALRLVRCAKNRYGPAHEVGCFEMTETGLAELADPSKLFLSARESGVPGVACTVSLEGRRPLVTEVQALVVPTALAMPRRTAQGLDAGRLIILVAVLERRARVALHGKDVFAATAGGVRITEPAADLALCLALASAVRDRELPADLVVIGEVGLGGEVRPVPQLPRRLAEAARLGFRRALVPPGGDEEAGGRSPRRALGMEVVTVGSVAAALGALENAGVGPGARGAAVAPQMDGRV